MIALSWIAPQQQEWVDDMQNWLSSLGSDCDVPEVWDLFLTEFNKKVINQEHHMKITYTLPPNAP